MFPLEPGDDPQFLQLAAALVLGSLESCPPCPKVLGLQSARLAWYSGNSLSNRCGSLMVYDFRQEAQQPWYVELCHGDPWKVGRCRGVSPGQASAFAELGSGVLARGQILRSLS